MKKVLYFLLSILLLAGCSEDYELNEGFTLPSSLSGPREVTIDLQSSSNIILEWDGGADDGGILLYNVLFDTESGDFSSPIYSSQSDFGANRRLTLTHVLLNKIARAAGLKTAETGKIKWTVEASRGGVIKRSQEIGGIQVTRPAEEIPERLYLLGSASENGGTAPLAFRKVSDGIFVIYTKLGSGGVYFTDALENGVNYTIDAYGKIIEGDTNYDVEGIADVVRLTLDFNAKTFKQERILGVRMIWGASFDKITDMPYVGNGVFEKEDVYVQCYDPNDSSIEMPPGISWFEERYYFIATIDGTELCWGRGDGISTEQPSENESTSFYELHEFVWSQWDHLWKMNHAIHKKHCTVTINTNENNMMLHSFLNVR